MRGRFSEFSKRLVGREHSGRKSNKHGIVSRRMALGRRLRCEPLEDRRLLSVAGSVSDSTAAIEMFHMQDALFAENA
ncbi:MAG: hypothetical protein U9N87_07790 [Planctomycetota bacterium]|nr:hypothetical protein [Planctomycetota bacterium]